VTITTLTKLDFLEFIEQHPIVDKDIVIRTVTNKGEQRGRNPDVSVVSASLWNSHVTSYGALIEPVKLAVEVISTNWEDDYIDKLEEYENMGIKEYWIVDYLAIASRSYLGNPK
jgi:Uma2 family endonuclease